MNKHSIPRLLFFILIAEAAGLLGVFFTGSIDTWYVSLVKPALNPPSWIFGPVWTILYACMATAAYLVWQRKGMGALKLYWVQLVVNMIWTPLFFGLMNPELALVDIGILLVLIILTISSFFKVHRGAAVLLIPYLIWVSFATYLNLMIALLN